MTTYYTEDHEWVTVEGDIATVGITDHAQSQLGDLVFVELPEVGAEIEKESDFIVVESVKAASDVYAPISGEITEINEAVSEDPSKVNSGAESDGWLVKMKVADASQLEGLMDKAAYDAMVG